ncbi:uncharacterized protein LOC143259210 isoform X2 [Megalopta genalis]|uniref:uncharacterized protein LOC143259210 isoform X2 n=1 Tax=Megalopta genalis TaxID=115081 RepID=UPI003FCF9940
MDIDNSNNISCRKRNKKYACDNWKVSLGMRNSIMYDDIPYVPMLVEHINIHCSCEDFEENGIKTIQTVGTLIPKSERSAHLRAMTTGNKSEFPVFFNNLSEEELYYKDDNSYRAIWDKFVVFKVYGTLILIGTKRVLESTHLIPVQDIAGTCNIFTLLTIAACTEYRYYYRTQGQYQMFEAQWNEMKWQEKRLLEEII